MMNPPPSTLGGPGEVLDPIRATSGGQQQPRPWQGGQAKWLGWVGQDGKGEGLVIYFAMQMDGLLQIP